MDEKTPEEWKQLAAILATSDPRSIAFDIAKRAVGDLIEKEVPRIRAYAIPNVGKHYGTKIVVEHPDAELKSAGSFRVWLPVGDPRDWREQPVDDHYESRFETEVVRRIVDAINSIEYDNSKPEIVAGVDFPA